MHEINIQSQRLAENVLNSASILLCNRIHLFFRCGVDFRTVWMVTSFHLFFWLPLSGPVDLQVEVVPRIVHQILQDISNAVK